MEDPKSATKEVKSSADKVREVIALQTFEGS